MDLYIVTGASRGLGFAFVEQLGNNPDAAVLALSRSGLPQARPRSEDIRCDLAARDGQRTASEAISALLRRHRWNKAVLINNAGMVEPVGSLESCDPDELAQSLELNMVAPVVLMQVFMAASEAVPSRTVINISSGAARRPYYGWTAYCAGKAGLDMATQVVALEQQRDGGSLRVVSLAPGVIDTAMQAAVRRKDRKEFPDVVRFQNLKAKGELEDPNDIAARILELERAGTLPDGLADLRDL